MTSRLLLGVVVGLALSGPSLADDDTTLLTANGLLNRGLYELAAPQYQQYLAEHAGAAEAPTARYGLAVCFYRLGRHAEALGQLGQIEASSFAFGAEVELLRGHCALAEGRFDEAAAALESLLAAHGDHPSAPDAAALLVEAHYRGGAYEEALRAASRFDGRWRERPASARAGLLAGMALMAQGQWAGAADRLEQERARSPRSDLAPQLTLLLAQSLQQSGDAQRARREYERLLEADGAAQYPAAALGLAQIMRASGELEQAGATLDELLEAEPEAQVAQLAALERARVQFDQGDYRRARQALERLGRSAPAELQDDIAYWSAKCRLREGEFAGAVDGFGEALAAHPDSELAPEMLYDRAVAMSRAGDDEADALFAAFAAEYPERAQAGAARGALVAAAHRRGEYERSVALADEFLLTRADHELAGEVALLRAEGLYLQGEYEAALAGYDRALGMSLPADRAAQGSFRRAMTLHRLGRLEEAQAPLEQAAARAREEALYRPALLALGDSALRRQRWGDAARWMEAFCAYGLEQDGADDAMIKLGLARRRMDDLNGAGEAFAQVLARWPESPHAEQARFELAQAHIASQRDAEARGLLLEVAAATGSRFAAYAMNHLGAMAQREGDHAGAADWYQRAAEAGGEALRAEASFGRARALLAEGRHDEAARAFDEIALEPADAAQGGAARALAIVAMSRAGRHEEAAARCAELDRRAIGRLEPSVRSSLRYEQAWSLRQLGRDGEAADAYRALLADEPDPALAPYATLDLASIHRDAGRWQEAVDLLTPVARSQAPADAMERARYQLGACALELGDHEAVVRWLESFHADFAASELAPSADLLCAEAMLSLGQASRAVGHLERAAASQDPAVAGPALLRLGEAQSALQRWQASEQAFAQYLERFEESELWFQARFGVGFARENQGRFEEAIEAYRPVADGHKGPTAARAQFQIGECLFAREQHEEAVRELLKTDILHGEPQWSAAALYEAGRCFEAMNKRAEAAAQYEQVVQRFADSEWAELARRRLQSASAAPAPGRNR
ncbi:MAG: tetratricopeptide repeat protein [Phycisphaerales bacterium JB039]